MNYPHKSPTSQNWEKKKKKKKPEWCLLYHIIQQLFAKVSNILNPWIIEIKNLYQSREEDNNNNEVQVYV
jgi:hypothetical protein